MSKDPRVGGKRVNRRFLLESEAHEDDVRWGSLTPSCQLPPASPYFSSSVALHWDSSLPSLKDAYGDNVCQ